MAIPLAFRAWLNFLYADIVGVRGFKAIRQSVKKARVRPRPITGDILPQVMNAVTTACILYPKSSRCLQRSVVVTKLLRHRGVNADLVIGCHPSPLRAHAWVEVAGKIVSEDAPYVRHMQILDRW